MCDSEKIVYDIIDKPVVRVVHFTGGGREDV